MGRRGGGEEGRRGGGEGRDRDRDQVFNNLALCFCCREKQNANLCQNFTDKTVECLTHICGDQFSLSDLFGWQNITRSESIKDC